MFGELRGAAIVERKGLRALAGNVICGTAPELGALIPLASNARITPAMTKALIPNPVNPVYVPCSGRGNLEIVDR